MELTDASNATVTATPFVPPTYPATLTILTGTDQVQALNLQEIHKDAKTLTTSVKTWRKPYRDTRKTRSRKNTSNHLSTKTHN